MVCPSKAVWVSERLNENLFQCLFVFCVCVGLVLLADSFPEQILQRLLVEYQATPNAASSSRVQCLETRLKAGEALMRASRSMGGYSL